MKLRTRLNRLERSCPQQAASKQHRHDLSSDESWLAYFEELAQTGDLAGEPDFPVALASYRVAIEEAKASIDPPWQPPADWNPYQYSPELRLQNWRSGRFPKVHENWEWLAGMLRRRRFGLPPVTEAEIRSLAAWLRANAKRLDAIVGVINVDDRQDVRTENGDVITMGARYSIGVDCLLQRLEMEGAKAWQAGAWAEAVRKLVAKYGDNGGESMRRQWGR